MFVIMAVATDTRAVGEAAAIAIGGTVGLDAMFGGPISGASMNPARSIGPAVVSGDLHALWLYIVAPLAGAALAALALPVHRGSRRQASEDRRLTQSPHRRRQRRRDQRRAPRPRARPGRRGHGRARGRLPELLDLRLPVLPLRRGPRLANLAHRTDRRARGRRDRAAARAHGDARSTRDAHIVTLRAMARRRERAAPTTGSSSRPAPSRSARPSPGIERGRRLPAAHMGDTFAAHARARRTPQRASSSAPATSAWRWPKRCTPAGSPSRSSSSYPRCCPPSTPSSGALVRAELEHTASTSSPAPRVTRDRTARPRPPRRHGDPASTATSRRHRARRRRGPARGRARRRRRGRARRARRAARQPPMRTGLPDVFAAGDCVITHHRLLGATPTCRSAPPRTSRAGSPARTPSAATAGSRAASAPRSSRSSTRPPPAPACATHEARAAGFDPVTVADAAPTTTRPTTPAATASPSASPATAPPDGCSACSCSGTRTPRSPSASTSPPPRSTTA